MFQLSIKIAGGSQVCGQDGACSLQGPVDVGYCGSLPLYPHCTVPSYISEFHRDCRRIGLNTVIMRIKFV